MTKKTLTAEKTAEELVEFLSLKEMNEIKYSIRKELAWKTTQLEQLSKGLMNNIDPKKIPKSMVDSEQTQEEWLRDKISILLSVESKLKILTRMKGSQPVASKLDKLVEEV